MGGGCVFDIEQGQASIESTPAREEGLDQGVGKGLKGLLAMRPMPVTYYADTQAFAPSRFSWRDFGGRIKQVAHFE
jgi:hypothetical protein